MPRLRWVLLGLYLVLVVSCLALWILAQLGSADAVAFALGLLGFGLLCQVIFLRLPGRPEYFAPVRPRRLLLPALVAGLMMTVLLAGLFLSLNELFREPDLPEWMGVVVWIVLVAVWALWAALFYVHTRSLERFQAVKRMIAWLLGGSLLQLLATVPSHIIVVRRPGCLVGMQTAMGLFAGLYVMIWSFGPGIMLLFWAETRRRTAGHCPACGYNLRGLTEQRCPECGRPFTFYEIRATPEQLGFAGTPSATHE